MAIQRIYLCSPFRSPDRIGAHGSVTRPSASVVRHPYNEPSPTSHLHLGICPNTLDCLRSPYWLRELFCAFQGRAPVGVAAGALATQACQDPPRCTPAYQSEVLQYSFFFARMYDLPLLTFPWELFFTNHLHLTLSTVLQAPPSSHRHQFRPFRPATNFSPPPLSFLYGPLDGPLPPFFSGHGMA